MTGSPGESEEVLRARYECAACGLLSTSPNGAILRANQTFCRWVGYEPHELVGARHLQDLLTMGSRIFHQTHWMPLLQIQGSVAELQIELVHRDGRVLHTLVNAQRRVLDGEACHEVAVFLAADRRKYERELLLARRRAEELLERERAAQDALRVARARLRLALDSAHLLVWEVDVATGAPTYDPGVRDLLRLPRGAAMSAEVYRASMHPDDRAAEEAALRAALAAGGDGVYAVEYRLIGHDGVERVVSSSGRAVYDDAGRPTGFSGVLQDVTHWRLAEAALRSQELEARARAVLAEQLIGIVSHDLRTPLQAVALGASLLTAAGVTAAQARTVARITAAADRANRLIADLLDFTQARLGGGLRVARSEVDLHGLVADVVEELKLAWPGRVVEHHRRGDGVGHADPDRIAQTVTNLGNNALTYGAADRPVTVTSTVSPRGFSIEVHNDGPVIPDELLPHLFEAMRRGEQQVKLGSRSVGLGLFIVHQIVTAHGGQITVRSTPTEGTTFALSVPSSPETAHATE
ncbi:MAG: ATP-binding protein [Deltaproteobacteria bacterium]|nr:ATP-binding protein [Myxococcales bacterium]MDP3218153.1 ATP-binding protein [Deltaproteobacteria bacterium]